MGGGGGGPDAGSNVVGRTGRAAICISSNDACGTKEKRRAGRSPDGTKELLKDLGTQDRARGAEGERAAGRMQPENAEVL